MGDMSRQRVYDLASQYTRQDRNTSYGTPENNFATIAAMWTAYWKARPEATETFTSADVAAFMALVKVARIANNPAKGDSWVDLAGYAACGAEVAHAQDPEGDKAIADPDKAAKLRASQTGRDYDSDPYRLSTH